MMLPITNRFCLLKIKKLFPFSFLAEFTLSQTVLNYIRQN
jgi:hypothetical protein